MNELKVFDNTEFGSVRTTEIDGTIYFVGKDVATALGYTDTAQAIRKHVDDEDKLTSRFDNSGQSREMTVINESGLYSLVLSSKLESAKRFRRWITSEVIPSIRKNGSYSLQPKSQLEVLQLAVNQMVEQERRLTDVEQKLIEVDAKVTTSTNDYYTIAGYASLRGKKVDVNKAGMLGRYATKLSKQYGYDIGRIKDVRFGYVNTYHLDVLKDVFRNM